MDISFYNRVTDKAPTTTMDLITFLLNVKNGQWKEQKQKIKSITEKPARQAAKKELLPSVTLSGIFKRHKASDLQKHSGALAIDIDDIDISKYIEPLQADPHCMGLFLSISDKGLCFVMPIDPENHLKAFLGAEKYFYEQYGLTIDKSCKDVSRLRYVSYDPNCYINKAAKRFVKYLKPEPKKRKASIPTAVHITSAFDHSLQQIQNSGTDILNDSYERWLAVGFAFADEFGESGRDYFHTVSRFGAKYDAVSCDKQYSSCLAHPTTGKAVGMGTYYHYCKEHNIEVYSPELTRAITYAQQLKRKTTARGAAIKKLAETVNESAATQIINQVYDNNKTDFKKLSKDKVLSELVHYILTEFDIRKDVITGRVEINREPITDDVLNGMYIECKMVVHPTVSLLDVTSIVYSNLVQQFEPVNSFVAAHQATPLVGDPIQDLVDCIKPKNEKAQAFNRVFFKKWMVGMIANIHNNVSPLVLVLVGIKQHTGKTEFLRRLLPRDLMKYYNESKLDAGKDDERLMCQSILIMDDEFGGKSKLEEKRFKEVTSKRTFTIRLPYGRNLEQLPRMATLCGTTNDHQIINDTTGNRRLIPIQVDDMIDIKKYNAIDKNLLFMQAWNLYHSNYNYDLTPEEIALLNELDDYSAVDTEEELILKHFSPVKDADDEYVNEEHRTGTDILEYIVEQSQIKSISKRKIGIIMKKHGFESSRKVAASGSRLTVYNVWRKESQKVAYQKSYQQALQDAKIAPPTEDDLPF